MRMARINDYWKTIKKRNFKNYPVSINFNDCAGYSGEITFNKGITAICGLNGVGKSTLISSIKSVFGCSNESVITQNKKFNVDSAKICINDEIVSCDSKITAVSNGLDESLLNYIDSDIILDSLKFFSQASLSELLVQYEPHIFDLEELSDINDIVGKNYTKCEAIEVSDAECDNTPIYFRVEANGITYDSLSMGLGELFLIHLYYLLTHLSKDSILIIEEPETYASIISQNKLMGYISRTIADKGTNVILSTHSPYVLNSVPNNYIIMISSFAGKTLVQNLSSNSSDFEVKEFLGCQVPTSIVEGTVYVEDYVARIFLEILLDAELPILRNRIAIESLNGESEISKRLEFPHSNYFHYKLIGVYDADIKNSLNVSKLQWPYYFLPLNNGCVEQEIYEYTKDEGFQTVLCQDFQKNSFHLISLLSKIEGTDHHDWLYDFCKGLNIKIEELVKTFFSFWKTKNENLLNEFIKSFSINFIEAPVDTEIAKELALC